MHVGDKVKRVHPSYAGSVVEKDKIYTVASVEVVRITLEELDPTHQFLAEAFEIIKEK